MANMRMQMRARDCDSAAMPWTKSSKHPSGATLLATRSFDDIYREHASSVIGFLRRFGISSSDVHDVNQEVFLAVHQQLGSFEGNCALKTWVLRIAIHKAYDCLRRNRKAPIYWGDQPVERPADSDQESVCACDEFGVLLMRALDKLSLEQREVFVLYELEGLPMKDVALAAGCMLFTAYTRLREARRRVRAHFDRLEKATRKP
jgi:RNA polymerase sigma-70 factor (ECF subfamily)